MSLFLREITENDQYELLSMIDEIKKYDDYEKTEGLSNIKKVTKDNFNDFMIELEHNKNIKLYNPDLVNQSTFILVDESGYIYGGTNIRHELNDDLLNHGGNIGYLIRPLERRKGYATLMLKLALEKCKELKIPKVLITCREDNKASAGVIEKNGGIYENSRYIEEKNASYRRYWIEIK